ncbi:DUF6493 family protein [Actinomadura atramentaria]|uniref:DUF6493 family protein n=1 Tax=Actinomadura atramentaria TaxID=1990 RepID=UPI00036F5F39|nr:DUF6493 family protein [Actinomadura atramentaria]
MTAWDETRAAIIKGDAERVVALVAKLGDDDRREVARALPGLLKKAKAVRGEWLPWHRDAARADALLLAGVGCLPGASAAATWLCRGDLSDAGMSEREYARLVVAATEHRSAAWRADVAARVAGRLRWRDDQMTMLARWRTAAELTLAAGAAPPDGDGFVHGWLITSTRPSTDPFLPALLPRLFEVDEAGLHLTWDEGRTTRRWVGLADCEQESWIDVLTARARTGEIERAALLDGCLGRFLRGGRPGELRWFLRLHDALDPSDAEVAARLRDYLRLLPAAHGTVAARAFAAVRALDAAGGLDAAGFGEAADALLFRPEKTLVKSALGWLNSTARRRADGTLRAVTAAFLSEALDVQEKAAACAVRHAAHASDDVRAHVREAAAALPGALRERVAAAYGPVEALPPVPFPELSAYVPKRAPEPYASAADTAHAAINEGWDLEERVLADLVAWSWRDRDAMRAALLDAGYAPYEQLERYGFGASWTFAAVLAVLGDGTRTGHAKAHGEFRRHEAPGPRRFAAWRLREVAHLVGRVPVLLATPTEASGALDPDVLRDRLAALRAAGAEPGRADVLQAVLRLPRAAADLAESLLPGAGAWFDAPVVTCGVETPSSDLDGAGPRILGRVELAADGLPEDLVRVAALPQRRYWPTESGADDLRSWPAVFPHHREVAAAHLLPHVFRWARHGWDDRNLLGPLAAADGPPGPATAAVLAYGLGAAAPADRAVAVDALLVLAARDALDAAGLGAAVAALAGQGLLKVGRAAEALGQAADAGAHRQVADAVAAALPGLLPPRGTRAPHGLPDLLTLASRIAETAGHRADVPALAEVAGRGGATRLVREAARLHRAFTAG